MVADGEAELLGHRGLALLDARIHELFDAAAVKTHDMVVMRTLVELEHRHAILEVVAGDQACGLELREHAVHRGKADVLVGLQQRAVDVLGREVAGLAALEDLEDLQPRQGYLQPGLAQVLAFQRVLRTGARHLRGLRRPVIRYDLKFIIPHRNRMRSLFTRLGALALLALASRLRLPPRRPAGQLPGEQDGRPAAGGHDPHAGALPARHADGAERVRQGPLGLPVLLPPRPPPYTQRQVVVYFKDDKVAKFDTVNMADRSPAGPRPGA